MSRITYKIDGTDLKTLGIGVSASKGIIDPLKMKEPLVMDWPDYHGQAVDLAAPRFESRKITLDCWCEASSRVEFVTRVNSLVALLSSPGLHRLEIGIDASKPLVYEVYRADASALDKSWRSTEMFGVFSLQLIEPSPVKKILKYTRTGDEDKTVSIDFESDLNVMISWGDGTYSMNQSEGTITHDYTVNGNYIIVIAGVISDITSLTTNASTVWAQL